MTYFDVVIRKRNTLRELWFTVESDSEANAKAEASRMFQWKYGFFPSASEFVSVTETHRGRLIFVQPLTKRAKQIVKEHGDMFRVLKGPVPMQCFDNKPGYQIETVDGCGYRRNIQAPMDKLFFWDFVDDDK